MSRILTADEARKLDHFTSQTGIPELTLMENAARETTKVITDNFTYRDRIVLLCGMGNNGGDALAVARMLSERGYDPQVFLVGDGRATDSQRWQMEHLCVSARVIKTDEDMPALKEDMKDAALVVDGIFGIGLHRDVEGIYARVIEAANESPAKKLAIDIPSGINADTGAVCGVAMRCDITVTFGYKKYGHILYPGRAYCGEVYVKDIGFAESEEAGIKGAELLDKSCLLRLPERIPYGNKGTYGKLFVRAGSTGMAGAALLCSEAAYRTGLGLVYISSPETNRTIIQLGLPEAVYTVNTDMDRLKTADAALFGPGISTAKETVSELTILLQNLRCPAVLDADALNICASAAEVSDQVRFGEHQIIMTPHIGEAARLLGKTIPEVKADMPGAARELSEKYKAVIVLKDACTIITDGTQMAISHCGSDGAATGGSGDVLAGIIAGLLAAGMAPYDAASVGTYIHDGAGALAAEALGNRFMLARDILRYIGEVMR